jgi:hypothetical protein
MDAIAVSAGTTPAECVHPEVIEVGPHMGSVASRDDPLSGLATPSRAGSQRGRQCSPRPPVPPRV